MKLVGQLKDSVAGLLTGTNLSNVTNLNGAIERAARTLVQQADIPEASGKEAITLYDGVYDYVAPVTVFGSAITDLRPQGVSRSMLDYVYKDIPADFDRTKGYLPSGYKVTLEWRKGVPILRVSTPKPFPRANLDPMKAITGWTAAGSASGLAEDGTVYYESPSSLRLTLTGSSTGTLEKTINPLNLAKFEDVGVAFLAVRIPNVTNLTSIALRLGSDSSNYDEVSATAGFLGAWASNEWLIVAFNFSGATSTGTPDWSVLDYLQVRVAHTDTMVNFRVGGLWIALPSPHELLFQSSAIFMADGQNPSQTITDDNDQILLNDAAYTLFEYECALTIALQNAGGVATKLTQNLTQILHHPEYGLYPKYSADNPSQELRTVGMWYD